jgi:acyl-CoA hydrolase
MIPVEGHKGLYRDEKSNAIVNCNDYEYQEYLRVKTSSLDEKTEIQNLKNELSEIKSLLTKLLENKT